jgi:hypothetical protein
MDPPLEIRRNCWTKSAWLMMKNKSLAGQQLILLNVVTTPGSSPKGEIFLFNDGEVDPKYAIISNRSGRVEIEDQGMPNGVYVNRIPVGSQSGDQLFIGKTVLKFGLKDID